MFNSTKHADSVTFINWFTHVLNDKKLNKTDIVLPNAILDTINTVGITERQLAIKPFFSDSCCVNANEKIGASKAKSIPLNK